jgi:hypothetical protein
MLRHWDGLQNKKRPRQLQQPIRLNVAARLGHQSALLLNI